MEARSPQSKRFLCLAVSYVLWHGALNPSYLIGVNFSSFHKILVFGAEILSHDLFRVGHFTLDTYENPLLLWFCECKTSLGKILSQEGHSYPGVHCIWSQTKGNGLSILFDGFQCKVLCVLTSTTQSQWQLMSGKGTKGSTLMGRPLLPSGLWAHPCLCFLMAYGHTSCHHACARAQDRNSHWKILTKFIFPETFLKLLRS